MKISHYLNEKQNVVVLGKILNKHPLDQSCERTCVYKLTPIRWPAQSDQVIGLYPVSRVANELAREIYKFDKYPSVNTNKF